MIKFEGTREVNLLFIATGRNSREYFYLSDDYDLVTVADCGIDYNDKFMQHNSDIAIFSSTAE